MRQLCFPSDFMWGVATSAFQIEGSTRAEGRGESIWDRFATRVGAIEDGSDGEQACDHYRRWREDLDLIAGLGVKAYRFSIAWPRIQPEGRGPANEAGLDHYDRLVDRLLTLGITPHVTLYHWDLPQALQDLGGWPDRDTAHRFVEYAGLVSERLGDRVSHWCTHNEPWCIAHLGHQSGEHAPGLNSPAAALATAHHLLLSHAWSVPVLRENSPGSEVGIVLNLVPGEPASPSEADAEAARRFDAFFNRWYLDPLFRGRYPADGIEDRIADGHLPRTGMPFLREGDLEAIQTPIDYLGVNYYSRAILRSEELPEEENAPRSVHPAPEETNTDMGWEVNADGLSRILQRLHREYAVPRLLVTENGAAFDDPPDAEDRVRDERRRHYLATHFSAAHEAIEAGVPLVGYFVWSLMDNFEWAFGYTKRFGIVWVDYETQRRILKDSARWYTQVIAEGGLAEEREGSR